VNIFLLLSKSPTNPQVRSRSDHYDVAELFDGPIALAASEQDEAPLDEKLRQAYFWIVNKAIISPHYGSNTITRRRRPSGWEIAARP